MTELWRTLKVGDKVRVVSWPPELQQDLLHEDTRTFYEWLIETQSVLRISEIDSFGLPYGDLWKTVDGKRYYEKVIVNHGGLELITK